jgi:hypothetical protein
VAPTARGRVDPEDARAQEDGDRSAGEEIGAGESNNPLSEAQFKTLKYCPQFPERFGSIEDGRAFGQVFFPWYNQEHRHSGLGFLTPAVVHFGQAATVRAQRQQVLAAAYAAHPERFVKGRPHPADLPTAVWINPPTKNSTAQGEQSSPAGVGGSAHSAILRRSPAFLSLSVTPQRAFTASTLSLHQSLFTGVDYA